MIKSSEGFHLYKIEWVYKGRLNQVDHIARHMEDIFSYIRLQMKEILPQLERLMITRED